MLTMLDGLRATRARPSSAHAKGSHRLSVGAHAELRMRTACIQALVPPVSEDSWLEVLMGMNETLATTRYGLEVRPLQSARQRDRLLQTGPLFRGTVGVAVLSLSPTPQLVTWLARLDAATVLVDAEHPDVSSVVVDHQAAAAIGVQHLLGLGHRRIAFVDQLNHSLTTESGASGRLQGYRAALSAAGIAPREEYERLGESSPETGTAVLDRWLASSEPPSAVFAGSDRLALGVLDSARRHGRRVPEDLAVVGYDDLRIARLLGLTTVHVPLRPMGQRAVGLLLDALEGPYTEPVRVRLPAELVIRRTCGATG
jgi:DNA-binding LacI/PurR family transcriptional regulator